MADIAEDLNYDFNYNMFLAKTMLTLLSSLSDRQKTVRWMRKLATCNRSIEEMKLRNDFMYYLVMNVQNGELRPPFTDNPPAGPLPGIAHLLPGGAEAVAGIDTGAKWGDAESLKSSQPLIYQRSPDGGAFLAAQPIPRSTEFIDSLQKEMKKFSSKRQETTPHYNAARITTSYT